MIQKLDRNVRQFLQVNALRSAVAGARFLFYARLLRRLRTLDVQTGDVAKTTVAHNLKGLSDLGGSRSLWLVRPLSVLDLLRDRVNEAKVLSIGPRTEGELLVLVAHGFSKHNIRALDLIAYSPWVDLGDMHHMPYADDAFDVLVCGWVLAYSDNRLQAAKEMVRVARPGAVIAVGVEYNPMSVEQAKAKLGYVPGSHQRIASSEEVLSYFEGHVEQVFLRQDPLPRMRDRQGAILVIFSVKK